MTANDLNRLAIIASAATEGDVRPEDVTALHPARIDLPGAGWTERETGLPPPDEGSFARGLLWGGLISLGLWCVILSGLYWALKLGVWK